jgi:hypothetical protein
MSLYRTCNMLACCGSPGVAEVTGGAFLPGEASSSCPKLHVRTKEQEKSLVGAGTGGGCSCFFLLNQGFRSSGLHPATPSKRKIWRDESSGSQWSNTGMPTASYFTTNSKSVCGCNVGTYNTIRWTVTLAELIDAFKIESEYVYMFTKADHCTIS